MSFIQLNKYCLLSMCCPVKQCHRQPFILWTWQSVCVEVWLIYSDPFHKNSWVFGEILSLAAEMSRSQDQKFSYPRKGLITRNTHMKYQYSSAHWSKVICKVEVFKKLVKLQGQGHKVKINSTHKKVLSQEILMWNIKALALTVQKVLARLVQIGGQNYRMTDRSKSICHPSSISGS